MNIGSTFMRFVAASSLGLIVTVAAAQKAAPAEVAKDLPISSRAEDPEASPRWKAVRKSVWGTQVIQAATEAQLQINAPKRAGDPAFVPIAIKSSIPVGQAGSIKRITLVIDNMERRQSAAPELSSRTRSRRKEPQASDQA